MDMQLSRDNLNEVHWLSQVQRSNLDADMNGQIILVGSLAYYASEIAPTLATRWSSRSITLENSIDFALKESSHWRTPNDDSSLELLLDENDDDLEDDDDDNDYNGRRLPAYLHIGGWTRCKFALEFLKP